MQPLDISINLLVSNYHTQPLNEWMKNHPEENATQFQVAGSFCKAWELAATKENIKGGFRACGFWPFDPDIFDKVDSSPVQVSDRPVVQDEDEDEEEEIEGVQQDLVSICNVVVCLQPLCDIS